MFIESDEGSVRWRAGLLGGGDEFQSAALEVEVGVVASFPSVGEEVAVKFVTATTLGVGKGQGDSIFALTGRAGPTSAGGGAAVLFAGPVAEVALQPGENGKKAPCDEVVEGGVKSAHGLAEKLAQTLVGSFSGGAGVDEVARFDTKRDTPVDASFPADSSLGKSMGVFLVKEGLGPAIAHLLFEVSPGSGPAMMPDERGSGEAERVAGIAKPPAKIDVVAGGLENGIETADGLEGFLSNGEVTTGKVLGDGVIEHDMGGSSGRGGREGEADGVGLRGEVGAADGGVGGFGIRPGQPSEPLFIGLAVIIGEGEDFSGGIFSAVIAGGGETGGLEVENTDTFLLIEEGGGAIG